MLEFDKSHPFTAPVVIKWNLQDLIPWFFPKWMQTSMSSYHFFLPMQLHTWSYSNDYIAYRSCLRIFRTTISEIVTGVLSLSSYGSPPFPKGSCLLHVTPSVSNLITYWRKRPSFFIFEWQEVTIFPLHIFWVVSLLPLSVPLCVYYQTDDDYQAISYHSLYL